MPEAVFFWAAQGPLSESDLYNIPHCPFADRKIPGKSLCRESVLLDYSWGPASTRALPASLPVYFTKFLMKRAARS